MSKECPLCYAENEDNAAVCDTCGIEFICSNEQGKLLTVIRKYFVTCPVCGRDYEVDDINGTIAECEYEEDEYDREQIKKQRAKAVDVEIEEGSEYRNEAVNKIAEFCLTDVRSGKCIVIPECGGVIGRSGEFGSADFFKDNPYISSIHFKIKFKENEWFVEHLSNTNSTSVNGTKLIHDMQFKMKNGDRIIVPECCFKVSIAEKSVEV